MNAYEFAHIPELTDDEKASPYSHFYYEPILPPAPEVLAAIQPDRRMDVSLALAPGDMRALFMPGSVKITNGYCLLQDGTGFSMIHTRAPEVTLEMERWWAGWFMSPGYDYLNYKIWMPSLHFTHAFAPGEPPYYATLVHYVTLGDGGEDVVTCVWSGVHILDGKPVRMIGEDERVDIEYVRLFACHNAWEFARKAQLLPRLHAFSKTL